MVGNVSKKQRVLIRLLLLLSTAFLTAPAAANEWQVLKDTTYPMDDSQWLELGLEAAQKLNGWLTSSVPLLKVSCREMTPRVELRTGISLEISSREPDAHRLRFRFGNEAAVGEDWFFTRDGGGLLSPSPAAFTIKLAQHGNLLLEVIPLEAEKELVHFELPNFDTLFARLREACGWEVEPPSRRTARGRDPVNPTRGPGRLTGLVNATITVDEQGNVIRVETSGGPEALRAAVAQAAWTWKFKPGTIGGIPVRAETTIPVTFEY